MSASNTSSKLGHEATTHNQTTSAPAQGFGGSAEGNPTSAQGVNNPATGGGKLREDGPAQEVAGTLSSNFTLKGMKAEYKGEDKVVGNQDTSGTAGRGGDKVHAGLQSHEVDVPGAYDPTLPRDDLGTQQRFGGPHNQ